MIECAFAESAAHKSLASKYVELHAASAFSFLEAASLPESLLERACELGMPAMALLDRNGLYGAPRMHAMAKKQGMRAHVGAEVALAGAAARLAPSGRLPNSRYAEPSRLSLLCESRTGYQNLCQLITRYKMREQTKCEGAATFADLEEFASGLICFTGGDEGPLASALEQGGYADGRRCVEKLVSVFGQGQVYVEIQRHGIRAQEWRNQAALSIAESLHLPVVATNGVRYAAPVEREILDLFTCIKNHTDLDHAGCLLASSAQRHLLSGSKMVAQFNDVPEAIENTAIVSQRLAFELNDLGYNFPAYPVPDEDTMQSFLHKRVEEGVRRRYGTAGKRKHYDSARKQAERELTLIGSLGFEGYFLIVWDIIRYCQLNNVMVQGRGSAANSVVCYALEITAVDPIGMELLFERFLNENRSEWPDIDLDLPSGDKREQAIQYVYRRYGELGAAMTANVITYRGKSAAREVGKALGFDVETQGRLSGMVGQWEWRGPTDTLAHSFRHAGFDLLNPRIAKYLHLCLRMQDLPRHLGQHSGGMVICQGALNRVVPIERASMPGRTVVQWDKEDCSELGIIKVDLLGLGMMAVLKECVDLIPGHYGDPVDIAQLPDDDVDVYTTLQKADTVGMFQVESRAQMASLPRNKPDRFYDLVVQVAIIRPGPIVGKMMNPYMRRRQKKEPVTYPLEELKPVLERTLGVPLFQEQLLRMAMVVAGFTGTEAEELRKAVGMRRSKNRMEELTVKLRNGMADRNIPQVVQDHIVQSISSFALYGFPESHAASFALLAYASAFFKVKYLAAFTCAMLNNQPMGFYSPAVIVKDAQRHGLRIKPVDIQCSNTTCGIAQGTEGLTLRLGLNYVKGLGATAAQAIVTARAEGGNFQGVDDVLKRVPVLTRREMAQLGSIGALNWLKGVGHRRNALWQVEEAVRHAGPLLHSASGLVDTSSPLQPMSTGDRLAADYAGTGLTTGPHPMSYRRTQLVRVGVCAAIDLQKLRDGDFVLVAGCVIARQRPGTALGFIFLSIEDETGIANIIIKPDLYEQQRSLVTHSKFLLVKGLLQNQDGVRHVKAAKLVALSDGELKVSSHDFH